MLFIQVAFDWPHKSLAMDICGNVVSHCSCCCLALKVDNVIDSERTVGLIIIIQMRLQLPTDRMINICLLLSYCPTKSFLLSSSPAFLPMGVLSFMT